MPRCPVCKTQADLIKYENVPIYNCGSCGGHWLTHQKLDVILARREVVMPEPVQAKMLEIAAAADSTQRLWCLGCGTEMRKEQFRLWPEVQLDHCPKCHGLWLDRGELEKCQILWEKFMADPNSPQMDLAARRAMLAAELAARRARYQDLDSQRRPFEPTSASSGLASFLGRLFG